MAFCFRSTLSSVSATSVSDPSVLLPLRDSHRQQHFSSPQASLSSGCFPRGFSDIGSIRFHKTVAHEASLSSGFFARRFSDVKLIGIRTDNADHLPTRFSIINLSPLADVAGKPCIPSVKITAEISRKKATALASSSYTGGVDCITSEEYREAKQTEVDVGENKRNVSQVEVKEVEEVLPVGNLEVTGEVGGGEGGGSGGSGWGNGGGRDGGGGDEDHSNKKKQGKIKGMSMSQKLTLAYAALVGVGGLIGYLKSGSTKSLISGLGSAALLFCVHTQLPNHPQFASSIGLGVSALLLVVMGSRFRNSGKLFPAGIVALFSFIMTGGYIHGIMRSSHSHT